MKDLKYGLSLIWKDVKGAPWYEIWLALVFAAPLCLVATGSMWLLMSDYFWIVFIYGIPAIFLYIAWVHGRDTRIKEESIDKLLNYEETPLNDDSRRTNNLHE